MSTVTSAPAVLASSVASSSSRRFGVELVVVLAEVDGLEHGLESWSAGKTTILPATTGAAPRSAPRLPLGSRRAVCFAATAGGVASGCSDEFAYAQVRVRGECNSSVSLALVESAMAIDVLVIGAGLSGLVTAFRAKRAGLSVAVFEIGSRPGGVIGSERRSGALFERGPNSGLDTTPLINAMLDDLGIRADRVDGSKASSKRYVLRDGRLVALPMSPGAFLRTPLFSFGAKLRLFAEPFIGKAPRRPRSRSRSSCAGGWGRSSSTTRSSRSWPASTRAIRKPCRCPPRSRACMRSSSSTAASSRGRSSARASAGRARTRRRTRHRASRSGTACRR